MLTQYKKNILQAIKLTGQSKVKDKRQADRIKREIIVDTIQKNILQAIKLTGKLKVKNKRQTDRNKESLILV